MYEEVSKEQKESAKGILSLFSLLENEKGDSFKSPPTPSVPVSRQYILKREYELLGIYLNGRPLDEFRSQLPRLSCVPLSDIENLSSNSVFRAAIS